MADTDADGLSDSAEATAGTDPRASDSDGDSLSDGEERTAGSDGYVTGATDADTDDDGLNDGEEAASGVNPHDWYDSSLCSVCHSEDPPFLQKDPMTTCARCHEANIENHPVTRHPLGQVPKIGIPVSLPLTEEGEMVCYTCHEPHGKTRHPHMLRVEYLKLCASCHKGY